MTNDISTLRDSNYGASRQSIMDKYDTNGDGKIDLAELHAFVDDYIINITNNDTLLDRVSNLRRLIGFGTILLLIIALSNLGTAILAANISKDTVIVNGRFVANDGSNAAISTTNVVESITKVWETDDHGTHRNLAVDGADTNATATASSPYVCLAQAEVNDILQRSINGTGTSLVIRSNGDDESTSQQYVVPIQGTVYSNQTHVSYPDSSVVFNLDTTGLCAGSRRKLAKTTSYGWGTMFFTPQAVQQRAAAEERRQRAAEAAAVAALLAALPQLVPTPAPPLPPPVDCGAHYAATCEQCPQGNGAAWCNGVCTWVPVTYSGMDFSTCIHKPISCGNHVAATCAECPQDNPDGAAFCNDECNWEASTSTCVRNT